MRRMALVIGLLLLGAANAGVVGAQPRAPFSTRDSAGVRVAVNGSSSDSAIAPRIALRIGSVDGDSMLQFHRIGQIVADQQGAIYVVNGATLSIRVFSPDGKFVRQIGRRGQGPGEFSAIDRIWFAGDTVVVTDRSSSRALLFRKNGTHIATHALRMPDNSRAELLAKTPAGWLAWVRPRTREFDIAVFTLMRDTTELRMFNPETRVAGPQLRKQPLARRIAQAEVYPAGPIFEPKSLLAYGVDGKQYFANDGQYEIDIFGPDGKHVQRVRREIPRRPITPRDLQNLREMLQGGGRGRGSMLAPGSEFGDAFERAAKYPMAPAFQQLGALLIAPDGSMLAQRIDQADPLRLEQMSGFGSGDRGTSLSAQQATRWERLDSQGRYQGAIQMPAKSTPRFFDGRNVLAIVEDDLGVQYVVRFGVTGG